MSAVLAAARRHIKADIAFLAEFRGESEIIRKLDGNGAAVGLYEGSVLPLVETYCYHVVNGSVPRLVPDSSADERVRDLPTTQRLNIGTYLGTPSVSVTGASTECSAASAMRPIPPSRIATSS